MNGNGPAADYPVVIGEPFAIDGVTYTPEDTMNYDRVGFVKAVEVPTNGVTGAHRTLPLPSYVEVTSLDSGRTILVRLERRGPMTSDHLLALSPDALRQLEVSEGSPIRMRRVNPPEEHRAALRSHAEAPLRMETPEGLLKVLRDRLPKSGSAELGDPHQSQVSGSVPRSADLASLKPDGKTGPVEESQEITSTAMPATDAGERDSPADGRFAIQVGAFLVPENAERLASKLGGFVTMAGKYALVRTGPYATRGQVDEALAKLRSQGYSDAEIRTLD